MKRSINSLIGFTMHATDGEIGKVEEFYFDDQHWTIRYLIVRTGGWLSGRKVLISPQALQGADWDSREFLTNLSTEQIRNSPAIDTDEPVFRQQEQLLYAHYPWQGYWDGAFVANGVWGILPDTAVMEEIAAANSVKRPTADTHLRSTRHVTGYRIHAIDGEIGKVMDYLVNDTNWEILFLVVSMGNWMKPGKILLSVKWIQEVNWAQSAIIIDIPRERVRKSRSYEESHNVDSRYEEMIFDHYGKPKGDPKMEFQLK